MIQHPLNPLQNLLKKQNRATPTRTRSNQNLHQNFSGTIPKNQYNSNNARDMSPNKLNATKKPIISINNKPGFNRNTERNHNPYSYMMKQQQTNQIKNMSNFQMCANHPEKIAEFHVFYDDEQMKYCQKCAINLASKGFEVKKIGDFINKNRQMNYSEPYVQFDFPQLSSMNGYNDIKELAEKVDKLLSQYQTQYQKYEDIDSHYDLQYKMTNEYYENLLETIQQMREDHLGDLLEEKKKHSQHAYIKINQMPESIKYLKTIRNDLIDNLEVILNNFDEQETQKNLNYYRTQIFMNYEHQLEDHLEFFNEIINYSESNLSAMLKRVESFLLQIWSEYEAPKKQSHKQKSDPTKGKQKNINFIRQQFPQKPASPRQNSSFRALFQNSKEIEIDGQTSPQFKNI